MNTILDIYGWEAGKDYPDWMNEISLATISKDYLLPGETPKKAYKRVSDAVAMRLDRPDLAAKFYKYMWKGWLCLASPVLANTGTDRGLPISCFGIDTPDSIRGIGLTNAELMKLTSVGGGVGISLSRIRGRGIKIGKEGLGQSEGVVPWAKIYDSTIIATNQGTVRRGASSVNLDINHPDIKEFLQIRRPKGDPNRQCLNLHQCVVVDDKFMLKLEHRDPEAMELWIEILKTRTRITEDGYTKLDISECYRILDKFKRAILAINKGILKQLEPLSQSQSELLLTDKLKHSIRSRLIQFNVINPQMQEIIINSLYSEP
jgi:ribonucleoside-diphosphate reductase alpha chain